MSKSAVLAGHLSKMMQDLSIATSQYMIIAGYCLHKMREVSDLDVLINHSSYLKLKKSGLAVVDIAKISKKERLVVNLPDGLEIEFFSTKYTPGFPSAEYSIKNLRKEKRLDYDKFGNAYFNIETCIKQYSRGPDFALQNSLPLSPLWLSAS